MGRRIGTPRPSPALIVAILALLAALVGTAVAGSEPGATNADKALKKANKALKLAKQNRRAIQNIELTPGPQGVAGPQGPPGVSGLEKVIGSSGAANSNSGKFATATCPAGKRAIGSGGQVGGLSGSFPNEQADVVITFLEPSDENTVPGSVGAFAYENKPTTANWFLQVTAICANVS